MALEPRVRKVYRCDRCHDDEQTIRACSGRLYITGAGVRLCTGCVRILCRVATI